MDSNSNEIWRDVVGYEGLYKVSTEGNIKSIRRNKLLSPDTGRNGYKRVSLYKNKTIKHYSVHRLVAQAFIPNPNNLPQVNHKDEDKSNNCVSNLEWITHKDNCIYGTRLERMSKTRSKPIIQLSLEGDFIREWNSTREAAKFIGCFRQNINNCLRGVTKTAYGYKWKYNDGIQIKRNINN